MSSCLVHASEEMMVLTAFEIDRSNYVPDTFID